MLLRSALVASTFALACSQANTAELAGTDVESVGEALLNGAPADDATYAAVGALVYYLPELGVLDVFCSATLVASDAVVTARHCTPQIDLAFEGGVVPAVAFGPDAFAPTQLVPITGYVAAPAGPGRNNGLLLDGGRDVAVAYLEHEPDDIRPAKLGQFDEKKMMNKRFTAAGYGVYDTIGMYGQKFAGNVTSRAIKGKWYSLLFEGDYDAYLEWYFTDSPSAIPSEAQAREWWKLYKLENNYELLAGGLPGDAMTCYGDSGGPLLLGKRARDLTVYGVSFAVEASISNICDLGGGFLVFNRKMLDFVRDALDQDSDCRRKH